MTKERKQEIAKEATIECYRVILEECNGYKQSESRKLAEEDQWGEVFTRIEEIIFKSLNKRT